MSIRSKLLISYILLIIFSVSILGFLIADKSKRALLSEVTEKSQRVSELIDNIVRVRNDLLTEKIKSDLRLAKRILENSGNISVDYSQKNPMGAFQIPDLYAGNTKLSFNYNFVDDIKKITGAHSSIFLLEDHKLIRISSNIIHDEKRFVGNYIDSASAIYKKIINNQPYYGQTIIAGKYLTAGYIPLTDKNHKIVGAIALGYDSLNPYLHDTLKQIKIGKSGYVYVMNSDAKLLVHPNNEIKNFSNQSFAKKIVQMKNGSMEYTFNGVHKIATYRYFEPWDWYIVTTANYDDFRASSDSIFDTILQVTFIIVLISSIFAIFISNTLVKPINKLKNYMEIAGNGDLTVYSDINSKDEIGVLSNSFNHMIKENKNLVDKIIKHDSLKTEFFANISHEVKTPLNILFSTTQLFSLYINDTSEELNIKKLNKYINVMKQNCYRLLKLVNNLIDITRLDSGFMELNLKNENIVAVIENITLSTAEYVEGKSRTLLFDTNVEEKIAAVDTEIMERIILNLISNALKFTESGDTIEVTLDVREDFIAISVKDTGIGIPEEKLDKIFQRFKQVDSLLSRRHEGSGIGLSLVKSLVELLDGGIFVKSKLGEGTEFIIDLPLKKIPEEDNQELIDDLAPHTNVEKIQIEFSDIYT